MRRRSGTERREDDLAARSGAPVPGGGRAWSPRRARRGRGRSSRSGPWPGSRRCLLLATLGAWLGSGGCGGSQQAAPAQPAPLAMSPAVQTLLAMETEAMTAYELAMAGDVPGVTAAAERLDALWAEFIRAPGNRERAADQGADVLEAISGLVTVLQTAPEPLLLARASNAVLGTLPQLMAAYDTRFPAESVTIAYLVRAIVLDARQAALPAAGAHMEGLERTWAGLRSETVDAGGEPQAARLTKMLEVLRRALELGSAPRLEVDANATVPAADAIQRVFLDRLGSP